MSTAARAPYPPLSDSLAKGIVNSWTEPILVVDQDLRMSFANQSFCDWSRKSWHDLDGQAVGGLLKNPQVLEFLRRVTLGSANHEFRANCDIEGRGSRALLLTATRLEAPLQQSTLLGINDVTNRKLSNSELTRKVDLAERGATSERQAADLLRSITESIGDGIFVADAQGKCVLWNPACERMLGVSPPSVSYECWPEGFGLYLPDGVGLFPLQDLPLARALNGESCDDVEIMIKNKMHPTGLWISVTARPLTAGQDGAVAAFRDITAAREAKAIMALQAAEVARSNKDLEQFAYVAAHDLQEPLRMVSSYVQLLGRRYQGKLDPEADEFIAFAMDGTKRMSQLINDLLDYSRVGHAEMTEKLVDCEQVLQGVLLTLSAKNAATGAVITHDPLPEVLANELQLTQVFQNLIDNAVKFRGDDTPRIHISARKEDQKWIFSISDNGIGIEPVYKERIFMIFQRLNSREDYAGTGIGLAICKKIVEKRDGDIWVEPNREHGTVVYFTWP